MEAEKFAAHAESMAAGCRLVLAVVAACGLVGSASAAEDPGLEAEAPYFCNSTVRTTDAVERAICGDKRLQVLYRSLEYELEDGMSQAVQADKIWLLDRLKAEHEPWEMKRDAACADAATRVACLRSLYDGRSRELAALLNAQGLKSVATRTRESEEAEAQRSAAADQDRQRESQGQGASAIGAKSTPEFTATAGPDARAKLESKRDRMGEPAPSFEWQGLVGWMAIGIAGFAWWALRRKRAADKTQAVPAVKAGQTDEPGSTKSKWGWGLAAAGFALIMLSRQDDLDRASKAVSASGEEAVQVASAQAASFPSGIWQCGLLGKVEFSDAGVFRNYNTPVNARSTMLLERIGYLGVGTHTMEGPDQLRVSLTRLVAVDASPEDLAALGNGADMHMEAIRKFKVSKSGRDVVLQETFRSFNGKVKEASGRSFVCTSQGQAAIAAAVPAQRPQAAAPVIERVEHVAQPPAPMSQEEGEDAVMHDTLRILESSRDGLCVGMGRQMGTMWGYFRSSGQARFKDEAMQVLGQIQERSCL